MIPKPLRERLGLGPGPVDVRPEGAGVRVEPIAGDSLEEREGRLVIPASGVGLTDDSVRALRDAGQR